MSKENAGIRVIRDDDNFLILWKTSNVALLENEKLIRPASVPVTTWIKGYLATQTSTVLFPHLLSSDISGIVYVAKAKYGSDLMTSAGKNPISVIYEVVLYETVKGSDAKGTDIGETLQRGQGADLLARLNDYLKKALGGSDGESNVTLLNVTNSGTYGQLYSVSIQLATLSTSEINYPALITECLHSAGMTCAKDGKSPFMSLVSVGMKVRESKNQSDSDERDLIIAEKAPSKFMKLMRRESILYDRLRENDVVPSDLNNEAYDSVLSKAKIDTVDFLGLQIMVPNSALKPRASSGLLVQVAVEEALKLYRENLSSPQSLLNQRSRGSVTTADGTPIPIPIPIPIATDKMIRIMDLGCGSGALLLATLSELSKPEVLLSIEENSTKSLSLSLADKLNSDLISAQEMDQSNKVEQNYEPSRLSVLGVGVDLDTNALKYAVINANNAGQTDCAWISADFGQLHTPDVRTRLIDAVLSCRTQRDLKSTEYKHWRRESREGEGLFDIILCNPPFLSSKATAGRVTSEGQRVLVGGLTGMEPYIAICNSIVLASKNSSYPRDVQTLQLQLQLQDEEDKSSSRNSASPSIIRGMSRGSISSSSINSNSSISSSDNQAIPALHPQGSKRRSLIARMKLKSPLLSTINIKGEMVETRNKEITTRESLKGEEATSGAISELTSGFQSEHMTADIDREILSSLPLLSDNGIIIFQIPGGEGGFHDVSRAIENLKLGFNLSVLKDERGVNRCVVLRKMKEVESDSGQEEKRI